MLRHPTQRFLGFHCCCSANPPISLHLQDGTGSLYTIVILILSMLSSPLCLISSGVLIPVLLLHYLQDSGSSVSFYSLSLFILLPVLRVLELLLLGLDQASPLLLTSYVPSYKWTGDFWLDRTRRYHMCVTCAVCSLYSHRRIYKYNKNDFLFQFGFLSGFQTAVTLKNSNKDVKCKNYVS